MITDLLLLLLPVAAASGWMMATRDENKTLVQQHKVPKDYLVGLNFLLNEQPDRAVDVFIKMLEVDSDTVETHLALGSLFRRRGEVDRAIRIHQNLIARPHLNKQQRIQSLLALGQDYMRAGVLDRAERIFLEVVDSGEETTPSLRYLLDIYQQEKAWLRAIEMAEKLETKVGDAMRVNIAHYYCELAAIEVSNSNFEQAKKHLRKAISIHKDCVRASLIYGDIEFAEKHFKAAIKCYKQVEEQDPDYLTEAIVPITTCYESLGQHLELLAYLKECLHKYPRISLVLILAQQLKRHDEITAALDIITAYLKKHPSIRGLQYLIKLQMQKTENQGQETLQILNDLTKSILDNKPIYRCEKCGFEAKKLDWLCPRCRSWNTVKPIQGLEGD